MPARHFARFDPALTVVLTDAFDRAWRTVESSGVAATLNGSRDTMREGLALRIVAMADSGMIDAGELAMDALAFVTDRAFPGTGERLPDL